jgi:amino acid permease
MELYTIAGSEKGGDWSSLFAFEGVNLIVLVILAGLLVGLGETGVIAAFIAAPIVALAICWRLLTGDRKSAVAERGRYYCNSCSQHFEGDALRQITQ